MSSYKYYRFIGTYLIGQGSYLEIDDIKLYSYNNVYPPNRFTSATSNGDLSNSFFVNVSNQSYGNGTYYIRSSTTGTNTATPPAYLFPWYAFNNSNQRWISESSSSIYSNTVGGSSPGSSAAKTTVSGVTICGEWIELQLPSAISVNEFHIRRFIDNDIRTPRDIVIAVSNDGTTWQLLKNYTDIKYNTDTQYDTDIQYDLSRVAILTNPVVPSTPSSPTITNITYYSLQVNWSSALYATSYILEQSTNNIDFTTLQTNITDLFADISGLTVNQIYYYRIIAVNSVGSSAASFSSSATTQSRFIVESSDNAIVIKWVYTQNETNYYIYQNDISYTDIMPIDILPKLLYQSTIITQDIINGYYGYYSIQPISSEVLGTRTPKLLIKALNVYDDIAYTKLDALNPDKLTNCIAWYDSADPTTILRDWGGSVLNIKNKINNSLYRLDSSRNDTNVAKPYYRNGYIGSFFGYDENYVYNTDYNKGTYIYCVPGSYFTASGLKLDRTADSTGNCVVAIVYTSKNTGQAALWGVDNGSWDRLQFINSTSSAISNGIDSTNVGISLNVKDTPIIYIATLTSNSASIVRVNGKTELQFTENLGNSGNDLQINALGDGSRVGSILVHEVVILKGPNWIMNDVYQLEGYFAHKWGITDKLVDNHPYKLIKPYNTTNIKAEQESFTSDNFIDFTV